MKAGERGGEREEGGGGLGHHASHAVTVEDIADACRGRGGAVFPQGGVGGGGAFSFVCLTGQSKQMLDRFR